MNLADITDPNAERHYLWRHYVEYETMWPVGAPLFLARDDLPRFFEWFAHNIGFVIHQDFRVGVESFDGVPSCAPGDGERWLAVRNMFLNEFGGYDGSEQSLWLLQAIPREWLRPGNRMTVKEMGTTFGGAVDLDGSSGRGRKLGGRRCRIEEAGRSSRKKSASACAPATAGRWRRQRSTASRPRSCRATSFFCLCKPTEFTRSWASSE